MSNLRGMNTVENESSELRCLGRGRFRGRTSATSGCQVHFHAFTTIRTTILKKIFTHGLFDLNLFFINFLPWTIKEQLSSEVAAHFHKLPKAVQTTLN